MEYVEFFLKMDLVVTVVSLVTMFVLMLLEVPIPGALVGVFIGSLALVFLTFLLLRLLESTKKENKS